MAIEGEVTYAEATSGDLADLMAASRLPGGVGVSGTDRCHRPALVQELAESYETGRASRALVRRPVVLPHGRTSRGLAAMQRAG